MHHPGNFWLHLHHGQYCFNGLSKRMMAPSAVLVVEMLAQQRSFHSFVHHYRCCDACTQFVWATILHNLQKYTLRAMSQLKRIPLRLQQFTNTTIPKFTRRLQLSYACQKSGRAVRHWIGNESYTSSRLDCTSTLGLLAASQPDPFLVNDMGAEEIERSIMPTQY